MAQLWALRIFEKKFHTHNFYRRAIFLLHYKGYSLNTQKIKKHTIGELTEMIGDSLQSEELHIHFNEKGLTEIPILYPFRSNNYGILLLLSGDVKLQLGLIQHELKKNEALIVSPNTIIQVLEIKSKVTFLSISFTYDFAFQYCFKNSNTFRFLAYEALSKFVLTKEEVKNFKTISLFLKQKNVKKNKTFFEQEMIYHSFNLLMYELASIYNKKERTLKISSRNEELALNFIKILKDNFKSVRNVQFYADALFVTRGHLTKVLKQVSGKTTRQLIEEVVIMEAKVLLSNPSLTILQITDELQFADQSFFGKFFKKNTGISPSFYRKEYLKQ